jgi:hypothetical protein
MTAQSENLLILLSGTHTREMVNEREFMLCLGLVLLKKTWLRGQDLNL